MFSFDKNVKYNKQSSEPQGLPCSTVAACSLYDFNLSCSTKVNNLLFSDLAWVANTDAMSQKYKLQLIRERESGRCKHCITTS